MQYQHILLCVDLGPQSLYIGNRAFTLATKFNAQITCMHTMEPPMAYTLDFAKRDKIIQKNKKVAQTSLDSYIENIKSKIKVDESKYQTLIAMGSPQNEILRKSHEIECDLIILGSHGIGGYTHLLGSTAHHVMSHAGCDVLIVQVSQLEQFIKEYPNQHYLWEKQPTSIPKETSNFKEGPPHSGSKHGFGENVSRGPRLVNRPSTFPYKGGHRSEEQSDEGSGDEDN